MQHFNSVIRSNFTIISFNFLFSLYSICKYVITCLCPQLHIILLYTPSTRIVKKFPSIFIIRYYNWSFRNSSLKNWSCLVRLLAWKNYYIASCKILFNCICSSFRRCRIRRRLLRSKSFVTKNSATFFQTQP